MKWKEFNLIDICDIRSGKRLPKDSDFSTEQTNYRYIRARDIKQGKIDNNGLAYISEKTREKILKYIVSTNDIVITIVGAYVGDVAFISEEHNNVNLTENAVRLTNCTKNVFSKYLFYVLNTKEYWELMQQIAGGSAQPKLGIYKIETIKVLLPSIEIQRRIAEILSAYDNLIENNQKQIKLLEEAAMLLYKEWFVKLRFPGHESVKIIDGLPEGWRKGTLHELIDIKYGKDHKKLNDGDIPIYGSGGVMRNGNKSLYMGASVLIPRKGSLNNIMFVDQGFWTVDTMFYSVPKRAFIMPYVYLYLKGWDMYATNTGAAVPSTTTETLNSMQILIPTEHLLEKFDAISQNYFSRSNALKIQIHQARAARNKLLPKLVNGEIEV